MNARGLRPPGAQQYGNGGTSSTGAREVEQLPLRSLPRRAHHLPIREPRTVLVGLSILEELFEVTELQLCFIYMQSGQLGQIGSENDELD